MIGAAERSNIIFFSPPQNRSFRIFIAHLSIPHFSFRPWISEREREREREIKTLDLAFPLPARDIYPIAGFRGRRTERIDNGESGDFAKGERVTRPYEDFFFCSAYLSHPGFLTFKLVLFYWIIAKKTSKVIAFGHWFTAKRRESLKNRIKIGFEG